MRVKRQGIRALQLKLCGHVKGRIPRPLEDRAGAARDILNTAGTVVDHGLLSSFGSIGSQSNAAIKHEQFFSGLLWDADSQLYYARARWYEPVSGKFLSEDPIGFEGGDVNVSRYSGNDPVNNVDRSGLSWLSHGLDQIGNAFEDVGHFIGDQWDNGNIQKGLLVAGTLASGGVLGFGLASGSLLATSLLATSLGFASGVANSYEVFSGNRIGDGTFTRVLGAAAAVTGGFYAPGVSNFGIAGRTISGASGLVSGYEIATGDIIGDGTLSSLFHVTNLGVNHASVFSDANASPSQRFGVGLNLAVGTASVFSSGDPQLQHSLRALSIASGVWNTTTTAFLAAQQFKATIHVVNAAKQPRRAAVMRATPEEEDTGIQRVAANDEAGGVTSALYVPSSGAGEYQLAMVTGAEEPSAYGFSFRYDWLVEQLSSAPQWQMVGMARPSTRLRRLTELRRSTIPESQLQQN